MKYPFTASKSSAMSGPTPGVGGMSTKYLVRQRRKSEVYAAPKTFYVVQKYALVREGISMDSTHLVTLQRGDESVLDCQPTYQSRGGYYFPDLRRSNCVFCV